MLDQDNPEEWMQQHHLQIIRHWILSRKRNEPDSSTEERISQVAHHAMSE